MPSAADVKAGRAYIELGINDKIGAGLNKVAGRFRAFGSVMTGIGLKLAGLGAAIEAPFVLAAKLFADMGDQINKASQRTGIGVETLQELKYAAEQSGISFEDLETAIRHAQKQGISTDEMFGSLADQIDATVDPTQKAALAMALFGKNGTQLIPMMTGGSKAIEKLRQELRDLGGTMSAEDAQAATDFGDALARLWFQIKMVGFQAGAAIAKALMPFADTAKAVLKTVIDFTKACPVLVVGIAALGAVVLATGTTFIVLATIVSSIGAIIAFVASPLGIFTIGIASLAIGIAAVAVAFFKFTEAGKIAAAGLRELGQVFQQTFGGMADALSSGNIELAAAVMFAGLKVIFLKGVSDLEDIWVGFLNALLPDVVGKIFKIVTDGMLAEAENELKALRGFAEQGKAKQNQGAGGRGRVLPGAGDFEDLTTKDKSSFGALGIFNGAALRSLQSAPVWDRVAKATEETAKNTRKLQNAGLR